MFLSGIADEAGSAIETQVKAHRELGWSHIEIRNVQGTQLTLVDDPTFEHIYKTVTEAGLTVSCFASGIANWATSITRDPEPVYDELRRAIPRMHRFGTKYIRIMSFPNDKDNPVGEPEWRAEAIKRVRTLVRMAEDGGVVLVHENCSGWGGTSAENNLNLIEEIATSHSE